MQLYNYKWDMLYLLMKIYTYKLESVDVHNYLISRFDMNPKLIEG